MKEYLKMYLLVLLGITTCAFICWLTQSFLEWRFVEIDKENLKVEKLRLFIVLYTVAFTGLYTIVSDDKY